MFDTFDTIETARDLVLREIARQELHAEDARRQAKRARDEMLAMQRAAASAEALRDDLKELLAHDSLVVARGLAAQP